MESGQALTHRLGEADLRLALQGWREVLGKLNNLPSRKPPGRLPLGELKRLGQEREAKVKILMDVVEDLCEYAPLLGRRSTARRLGEVIKAARVVLDFNVMMNEVLKQHSLEDGLREAELTETWLAEHQELCWEMGQRLEGVVEQVMRS